MLLQIIWQIWESEVYCVTGGFFGSSRREKRSRGVASLVSFHVLPSWIGDREFHSRHWLTIM